MKKRKKAKFKIDVLTLFPSMFDGPMTESLMGRAVESDLVDLSIYTLRKWSDDKRHQKVDDRPFGGGAGMVIRPEPIYRAIRDLSKKSKPWVVYLSPQGKTLTQSAAAKLSRKKHLILICGHYEGIDERIMEWVDQEVSIGDFILTGGEIPALALMDSVIRLIPGVVGDPESIKDETFSDGLLEYPHYTRPRKWRGKSVPDVLISGHHQKIKRWRDEQKVKQTKKKRPQLLKK